MEKPQIIKLTQQDHMTEEICHYWPFVYFHGQAEEYINNKFPGVAGDLVAGSVPLADLADGLYDAEIDGIPCFVYLWYRRESRKIQILGGLVVMLTDEESRAYARATYFDF